MLTVGSLFAGIGGFDLGLERAGMQVKWQVEIDPYCLKVLEKHWPHVRRYTASRRVDREANRTSGQKQVKISWHALCFLFT